MRPIILTLAIALSQATPLMAQGISVPTVTFPDQGVFCGPLRLCTPEVTQDVRD
jgi:hypothetical protein